jgi:hypothetical protein
MDAVHLLGGVAMMPTLLLIAFPQPMQLTQWLEFYVFLLELHCDALCQVELAPSKWLASGLCGHS